MNHNDTKNTESRKKTALILDFALIVVSSSMHSKMLLPLDNQYISVAKYKQNIRKKKELGLHFVH